MARRKSTEPEVVVTGKDYLREIKPEVAESILSDYEAPTLMLYKEDFNYGYYNNCFPNDEHRIIFVHGCKEGNGKPQMEKVRSTSDSLVCKYCGKKVNDYSCLQISTKTCQELNTYRYSSDRKESIKANDVVYVSHHETDPNLTIARLMTVNVGYKVDEESHYRLVTTCETKTALEINPGVSIKGYKTLKRSIKEMSAFEAMNINSQTINSTWNRSFVYEDAPTLFDYMNKDKVFAERTGIKQALKTLPADMFGLKTDPFMLLHMCMISEYPVLELLIKMGYSRLYYDIVRAFVKSQSKEDILNKVKDFQVLFTKSSKGSAGLRIPNYIGDYLRSKGAPIVEYRVWCNIYELQPLTKEQFNNYIDSVEFIAATIEQCIAKLPNIIKYGYTIEQATKYLYKQKQQAFKRGDNRYNMLSAARDMHDYLTMCEYLEIEPKKFPSNIKQSHDEVSKLRSGSSRTDYSKMMSVGKKTQELLDSFIDPTKLTKMEQDYFIKVPVTEADFIEEGNLQNSCVGHYAKKVNAGERIVFFVRKKDDPRNSFITAEYVCSTGQLGQCMYENNRVVEDEELLGYCKVACGRIKTGLLTGKIA